MRERRYGLRIGVVLLVMLDTIRRAFTRHDAFDYTMLVVEILVLALIFAEMAHSIGRHFKVERRVKRLRAALGEGQKLQNDAPSQHASGQWMYGVTEWIDQTDKLLRKYSVEAGLAFQHDPGAMFNPFVADSFGPDAKARYVRLQHCLNNLRRIIEIPDVYL